jgi:hypothetical protein
MNLSDIAEYKPGCRIVVHIRRDPVPFVSDKGPGAMPTGCIVGHLVSANEKVVVVRTGAAAGPLVIPGEYKIKLEEIWAIGEPSPIEQPPPNLRLS